MKNKKTQNLENTFKTALDDAFEPEDARAAVLSALASMSDEEIHEMRQTITGAQNALQAMAKSKQAN